ncbi:MAG: isochorismatase family protein [Candidatus Heimdallarchaeota archaeon]|nr:isochorismatase family protein [Candidatus Heimdallarchaeota archaeon]MCK4954184.1 isochorismatase family protein [Candidatus Heimdallarchaeota archaeon]
MIEEQTIIEEWERVRAPEAPKLEEIKISLKKTALLVLDIQKNNCNNERRPRCVKSLDKIQMIVEKARKAEIPVIFTLTSAASKADFRREVLPSREETIIKASVNKFYKTELEEILKKKKIKTIIMVGTSANGAVLHTAAGAVTRDFEVIVPVDGISATYPYEEQYSVWHLINSPGTRRKVVITKAELIRFI